MGLKSKVRPKNIQGWNLKRTSREPVQIITEFEAIFQVEDELKDHIELTYPESALEEISNGIQKFKNGLPSREIEAVNVGDHKSKHCRGERCLGESLVNRQSWIKFQNR